MNNGTMIDQLMAAVMRAEEQARAHAAEAAAAPPGFELPACTAAQFQPVAGAA